ncbi:unnamed protein product [Cyprideis torosa]|uniref:Uncharacterized protein n=1 Tax=Cyprideis torosa TaxID=163714 RepID=A0A7R8WK34_9CRUS|nr:unnamed protein product [Cyprideis torosa]CAG0895642.1 unnamed protein product [Cyprideis torosa]
MSGGEVSVTMQSGMGCFPEGPMLSQFSTVDDSETWRLVGDAADKWRGRVALVTGASGGIGASICRSLVESGMKVAGLARHLDVLEKLATSMEYNYGPGILLPVQCNIAKEEELMNAFKVVKEKWGGVDVLINNAGLAINENLLSCTGENLRYMMDVNVIGTCLATREAVASMRERNVDDGHIININSIAGHYIPPFSSAHFYCATKFALTSINEGLRRELRELKSKIRVTAISPGLTKTGFVKKFLGPEKAEEVFGGCDPLLPEDIAGAVVWAMSAPQRMEVNDILMRPTDKL